MPQSIIERLEKTREQIRTWSTERIDELQEAQRTLQERRDSLVRQGKENLQEGQKAMAERRETLVRQGTEALDNSKGALRTAEATVLEAARDLLSRSAEALGDRAPFLKRGEEALGEALVALRAGHHATLPVEGYDDLSIKKLQPLVAELDLAGLRTLRTYEANHKNRTTLLKQLDHRIEAYSGNGGATAEA